MSYKLNPFTGKLDLTSRDGTNGSTWYSGTTVPSAGLGADGDFYLRTTTSDVYVKTSGAWAIDVNIKGDQGNPGVSGISGAFTQPFSGTTSVVVNHNFNAYPIVQVIDTGGSALIPQSIVNTDTNNFTVTFDAATSGNIIASIGGVSTDVKTKGTSYTLTGTDAMILADGEITLSLPAPSGLQGKTYNIKKINADGIPVTVDTVGTATIDGQNSWDILAKYTTLTVFSDATNWHII